MEQTDELKNKDLIPNGLIGFFDLLARFDFEEKKREKSVVKIDFPVSAPGESILVSDKQNIYGADTKKKNK